MKKFLSIFCCAEQEPAELFKEYLDPNRALYEGLLRDIEFTDIYKSNSLEIEVSTCLEDCARVITIRTAYGVFFRHDKIFWQEPETTSYVITHLNFKDLNETKMKSDCWDPNFLRLETRLLTEDTCKSKLNEITKFFIKYAALPHTELKNSPALIALQSPADSENFLKEHLIRAGYNIIKGERKVMEENRSSIRP